MIDVNDGFALTFGTTEFLLIKTPSSPKILQKANSDEFIIVLSDIKEFKAYAVKNIANNVIIAKRPRFSSIVLSAKQAKETGNPKPNEIFTANVRNDVFISVVASKMVKNIEETIPISVHMERKYFLVLNLLAKQAPIRIDKTAPTMPMM
jgi:hypothetical protein